MAASDPFYRSSHGVSAVVHTSGSASNVTTPPTASADYTNGTMYSITVLAAKDSGVEAPTISGGGVDTWTNKVSQTFDTTHRITVFTGVCMTDTTGGALTITFISQHDEVSWIVLLLDGATGDKQSDSSAGMSSTQTLSGLGFGAFDNVRNATLSFTGLKAQATVSPPTIKQFSKVAEVQSGGGSFPLTLQAQWRSSNQPTVETTTSSSEKYGLCALEIVAETLVSPLLWCAIQLDTSDNKNEDPGTLLTAQFSRKKPDIDYAHMLYNATNIKMSLEWNASPTPFTTLRAYLSGVTFPAVFKGILWLDVERWGWASETPGEEEGFKTDWNDNDRLAYERMYRAAREEQPSAAIAGVGVPQRTGTDRDFLADHFDIGCPFTYLNQDWDADAVLGNIRDRVARCVDDLGVRCIPYVMGKYPGTHPTPKRRHNWIGGHKFESILRTIRDDTEAEGVVMWTQTEDASDRDLAKWAKYLQRMALGTSIPTI